MGDNYSAPKRMKLTNAERKTIRDYLHYRLQGALKGYEAARLYAVPPCPPGAQEQVKHWQKVMQSIEWLLAGVNPIPEPKNADHSSTNLHI